MKILQYYLTDDTDRTRVGIYTKSGIIDLGNATQTLGIYVPNHLKTIMNGDFQVQLEEIENYYIHHSHEVTFLDESDIIYAPIVAHPEKIVCVGLNYHDHVSESGLGDDPEEPILFSKFNNALAANEQVIPLTGHGEQYDYEGELVVVIGKAGKNIDPEDALDYVYGYSIGNDVSVRDLQFKSGQWLIGKTNDFSAPVGPYITTKDEVDVQNLTIQTLRNGEMVQSANTSQMIFDVPAIIAYISKFMTLQIGDIILTGTPSGVVLGYDEDKQDWLNAGDEIIISIEGLGSLTNTFEISED
ncbi:FAA hydrolase family protein [Aerococcus agrisoli]|uniref:FAA hydrolase family protein n=1 Tax=Aerococcus agrisoli TaxID=2487350 RepID=A0A3N4GCE7_9LACT|nr:fumarylacetoacetate hydrolase family protein [Aerococcus agrisoli]RPA59578.1 FAA hydrolase family protein [Aerococcus agrisoli]